MSSFSESSPHIINWATRSISEEIDKSCEKRVSHRPLIPVMWPGASELGRRLTKDRSVGITYDSCGVTEAGKNRNPDGTGCSHASVVVARQRNKDSGICEYKVRNSWGTDCSVYKANIRERCEGGSFWISEAELKPPIQNVVALE